MKKNIIRHVGIINTGEWLFCSWLLFYLLGNITVFQIPGHVYILSYCLFGICDFLYIITKRGNVNLCTIGFIVCVVESMQQLLCMIYTNNENLPGLLYGWCFMGVALILCCTEIRTKQIAFIYYFTVIFYLLCLLARVMTPEYFFVNSSRNGISERIIFLTCIYYVIRHKNKDKFTLFPALCSLLLSVIGIGRAGCISSALLIVLFLVYYWLKVKKGNPLIMFGIGILVVVGVGIANKLFGDFITAVIENFEYRGMESARTEIWSAYIKTIRNDILGLFFGGKTKESGYVVLQLFSENLHNSFFMLHHRYGLVCFVGFFILSTRSFFRWIRQKNWEYIILFSIISFRASLDWCAFPGSYEILYYYFLIYQYCNTKNRRVLLRYEQSKLVY